MSNRSWFFASEGKQQGPYPEAQLREFIANGTVTAETLVWTEGMAGWQKAGGYSGPAFRRLGSAGCCAFGVPLTTGRTATGQPLSADFSIERTAYSPVNDHLRSRSEPSCATEATSVPSCLKIMPRVRPRPPCALGESWA